MSADRDTIRDALRPSGVRASGLVVNDLLQSAGDDIDEAIAVLYQMLVLAVVDGENHVEGRINDALNLAEEIGALTRLGRDLAGHTT